MTTIAAFDFDKTLAVGDNVVPFLRRLSIGPARVMSGLKKLHRLAAAVVRRDRNGIRAIATDVMFAGRTVADVDDRAREFANEVVQSKLRPDTLARLRWHLDAGHLVVIVSASYEVYLRPVAHALGAVDVLGTQVEAESGRYTGRLSGQNCRGPEKVTRLETWLADRSLNRAEVEVHAYGDSAGDREMLEWADHPHWVNDPLTTVSPSD